jgi:hypothetical protein
MNTDQKTLTRVIHFFVLCTVCGMLIGWLLGGVHAAQPSLDAYEVREDVTKAGPGIGVANVPQGVYRIVGTKNGYVLPFGTFIKADGGLEVARDICAALNDARKKRLQEEK